ncbi:MULTISPECIES: porin [Paraburkholderia]|uniref:Porin n=1 Tax=Paraburkholderia podalyriae TaxID=1938811 RepID=A0ABR7Q032_9BURK|nr:MULTISPECIES: porin [Paraburkholderia]MBC8751868.1 porin [Paraburkholderia podalyriae]MDH6152586.1 putative porin [Paraburkholderia sp. WSM4179]
MNSYKVILVAAGSFAACSPAFSQSSVTLYGELDESIQYVHNTGGQHSQISLQGGQIGTNKWGLKGAEDLGGGLQAVFRLENGFDINNGKAKQGGALFGRYAYVGMKSDSYGTILAGRQYDTLMDLVYPVQPNNYLYYFTTPGDVDNSDGNARINSQVKWLSPVWSGFRVAAAYSFGGVAGSMGSGQTYSFATSYTAGPLMLAAGYSHADQGNPTLSTRGTSTYGSLFLSPVNEAYSTAKAINIARAGAKYSIGPVTLGGYYSYSEYLPDAYSKFRIAERYNNGSIYANWNITPFVLVQVGYDLLKSHGDSSATYNQVTLTGDYLLSKRTDVYASASYGHASGHNGLGVAQAVIADSFPAAGNASQTLVFLGMRHRF